MRLTIKKVERLTDARRHSDGGGLYLQITKTGCKSWVFRYELGRKGRRRGIDKCHGLGWESLSPVIIRTTTGGAHLWFKSDGLLRSSSDTIAHGVDTRGVGGYVSRMLRPGVWIGWALLRETASACAGRVSWGLSVHPYPGRPDCGPGPREAARSQLSFSTDFSDPNCTPGPGGRSRSQVHSKPALALSLPPATIVELATNPRPEPRQGRAQLVGHRSRIATPPNEFALRFQIVRG